MRRPPRAPRDRDKRDAVVLLTLALAAGCSTSEPSAPPPTMIADAAASDAEAGPTACAGDEDCAGGRVCDPTAHVCIAPCTRARCPADRHCDEATGLCVAGCSSDDGCISATTPDSGAAAHRCDVDKHLCVACIDDVDCPEGARCAGSSCVSGCTAAQHCPRGELCCAGACVDPRTDGANCGACGVSCAQSHSVGECVAGACVLTSCVGADGGATTLADCDQNIANGCEADLRIDSKNCGACGVRCDVAHGAGACVSGTCVVASCSELTRDCDGRFDNGCEANIETSLLHCGRCDLACAPASTEECLGGTCGPATCPGATRDCDGDAAHSCETDTSADPANCGGCGIACSARNAIASCSAGRCGIGSCISGYADCDGDPANGCETNVATNPAHCGSCSNVCATGRACGSAIVASMAALPADWQLNGSALQDATSGGVILNLPVHDTSGTVIYDVPMVIDAFSASFEFRIGFASRYGTEFGGDGIGFMLQQSGPGAIGLGAGGMGMAGLGGFGVEIDTEANVACGDLTDNHIAIVNLAVPQGCNSWQVSDLATSNSLPFALRNSGWHAMDIDWQNGHVEVALDHVPVLSYTIGGFPSGYGYFIGFAAAGGFNADLHEVRNVRITFPTPRCL